GTNWTVFNESNSGLPDNHIQALAIEETTGDKWIGTNDGGLVKFDGNSWVVYDTSNSGLSNNNVSAIIIEGGTKWIGINSSGLVKFDITKMWVGTNSGIGVSNKVFDDLIVFNTKNGLPNDTVYAIEKWNNYMWAGTKKGIARILIDSIRFGDSVLWDIVDTNFKVNDFCVVDTALWMACSQGTYRCELVGDTSCNWIQIANYDSRALLFDGALWIGTAWNGIVKYAAPIEEYKPEGPAANYFLNMAMDLNGGIWSSHWGEPGWTHNKVSKLYKDGNDWKWKIYSFSVPFVTNVMVDKKNNKWITMADWNDPAVCAVARIFPNDSTIQITIDAPGGANFVTGSCLDDNDDLWIASTDGYIRRIRNSTNQVDTAFSDPNGYTSWVCPMMKDADGNLWVGSIRPQCLVILKKDGTMQKKLVGEEFYFFNKEKAGEVWVGSTSGAYQFKNMQISNSYTISELGGTPRGMTIDSANIWFAISKSTETDKGGVRKLSNEGFEEYTTKDGLVNDLAKSVRFDQINKVLWVGTENGLSRFYIGSSNPLDTLSKIIVCPNPFMVSKHKEIVFYIDSIGISGDNSGGEVRIYTLSGRLLKKIEHINSSKVVWDGRDITGNRISSGVYLISAFNTKTNRKYLTKFAVIK
ncbi:MAG: hypothetical protein PHE49_09190, partial [bacterium]|nr:hypothetical protein [bacterium]